MIIFWTFVFCASVLNACVFPPSNPLGWLWYKEPPSPSPKEFPGPKSHTPTDVIESIKRTFERATAEALLSPTFTNVERLHRLQTEILNRADVFSRVWEWVTLKDASHWHKARHTNRVHRDIYTKDETQKREENLRMMARSYGLFLLFKTNCPYCHAFAPIVKTFADTYGFVVKAISMDGGRLAPFPKMSLDNGTIQRLNPEGIFPALFLINPKTKDVIPLSWGLNALSILEQHAGLIFEMREKGDKNTPPLRHDFRKNK